MAHCLIGLGSNLGDREESLHQAVRRLGQWPGVTLIARSRWRQTTPAGGPTGQGPFLNGAVLVQTTLGPDALLSALQAIEADQGRQRAERWGPRVLDLDLLLYDRLVLETPRLVLPHPRMAWRRFVLEPAAEVAPSLVHPATGWTIDRLLDHLNTAIPYVAITGPMGAGKTSLADQLAQHTAARRIALQTAPALLQDCCAKRSGNAWAAAVEFLDEGARLLAADLPPWAESGRLWVSDFWFDQSLAYARVWLPADRLDSFRQKWHETRARVIQPKLIVLLDPPPGQRSERPDENRLVGGPQGDEGPLQEVCREIRAEAMQPGRGPMLHLTGSSPQESLSEVLAAVEAMK